MTVPTEILAKNIATAPKSLLKNSESAALTGSPRCSFNFSAGESRGRKAGAKCRVFQQASKLREATFNDYYAARAPWLREKLQDRAAWHPSFFDGNATL